MARMCVVVIWLLAVAQGVDIDHLLEVPSEEDPNFGAPFALVVFDCMSDRKCILDVASVFDQLSQSFSIQFFALSSLLPSWSPGQPISVDHSHIDFLVAIGPRQGRAAYFVRALQLNNIVPRAHILLENESVLPEAPLYSRDFDVVFYCTKEQHIFLQKIHRTSGHRFACPSDQKFAQLLEKEFLVSLKHIDHNEISPRLPPFHPTSPLTCFTNRTVPSGPYEYAIGIYEGLLLSSVRDVGRWSDFSGCALVNPVIHAGDLTDIHASFVADPFIWQSSGLFFMFFEAFDVVGDKGVIAVASSIDGVGWRYGGVVIDEPFHLSFPYVFSDGSTTYMVVESMMDMSVRLYAAEQFPDVWVFEKRLLEGGDFQDNAVFYHNNLWWLFTTVGFYPNFSLLAFHSQSVLGPYTPHGLNPLIPRNGSIGRLGGRIQSIRSDGRPTSDGNPDLLYRFAQNCVPEYGTSVIPFTITELTPTTYKEEQWQSPNPLLSGSGEGWNANFMHHIDATFVDDGVNPRWIAAVDGANHLVPIPKS